MTHSRGLHGRRGRLDTGRRRRVALLHPEQHDTAKALQTTSACPWISLYHKMPQSPLVTSCVACICAMTTALPPRATAAMPQK